MRWRGAVAVSRSLTGAVRLPPARHGPSVLRPAISGQAGAGDRAVRRRRHSGRGRAHHQPQLTAQIGQTFVVENRSGADGVVGAQTVAEAPPDGYTLLLTSSSFVVNPSFHKKLPFDVIHDFEPVSSIAATETYILGINPRLPVGSVPELIALTRGGSNQVSFGSPGVGNGLHLAAELFKSLTKTQMVHVPDGHVHAGQDISHGAGATRSCLVIPRPCSSSPPTARRRAAKGRRSCRSGSPLLPSRRCPAPPHRGSATRGSGRSC